MYTAIPVSLVFLWLTAYECWSFTVKIWRYLVKEYHAKEPDGGADSRQLLAKALHHLETHYEKGGQFVPEFPRVLHLFGKDFDTVAPVYDRGPCGFPFDRYNALFHKALFFETHGRIEEAKYFLQQAIETDHDNCFHAEKALKRLNQASD